MYTIRPATPADAPLLPAIEDSAGQVFRQIKDLAWIADDGVQSPKSHLDLMKRGVHWVAVDASGAPIGFLNGEVMDGNLHIWEVSVNQDKQGKGVGRALMDHARQWAVLRGCPSVTLTTFRDVPWNEAFYQSLGYRTLKRTEVTPALLKVLRDEVKAGFPGERRCAMRLALQE